MAFSYILSSVDSPTTCSSPVSLYSHPQFHVSPYALAFSLTLCSTLKASFLPLQGLFPPPQPLHMVHSPIQST